MRRGIVLAFAILGVAACGQKEGGSGAMEAPKPAAAPTSPAEKPEAAMPAKPDVGAPATPESAGASADAASCLDLVKAGSYAQAVPVCTRALQADAANEEVKNALETAKSKAGEMAGQAAGAASEAATGAAQGAAGQAEGAAEKAKESLPAKPY